MEIVLARDGDDIGASVDYSADRGGNSELRI
jgi:hypothetical protein